MNVDKKPFMKLQLRQWHIFTLLWIQVLSYPLVDNYLEGKGIQWQGVASDWMRFVPFFLLFLLHNFIAIPKFFLPRRITGYVLTTLLLLGLFMGGQYAQLYRQGAPQRPEEFIPSSAQGEIGVIEGDNHIIINNSDLTSGAGSSSRGLMILQSGSGDAGSGTNGIITVTGGFLTMTGDAAPLVEIVTNVKGQVTLDGVTTTIPSGVLMKVDYNTRWSTYGATGVLILSGSGTTYAGGIVADKYSSAQVTVNSGVTWKGAFDPAATAKSSSLTLDGGTWTLTGNSRVGSIMLTNGATINKNGYTLAYDSLTDTAGTQVAAFTQSGIVATVGNVSGGAGNGGPNLGGGNQGGGPGGRP